MNIFFKNRKTCGTSSSGGGGGGVEVGSSEEDHQKGKLCTAGRKIIVLPQVKNIVALLKSACKGELHY